MNVDVLVKPSEEVNKQLGEHPLIIGVDIETHDWDVNAGSKGGIGQFGHYSRCNYTIGVARIVQIGWAVRRVGRTIDVKEKLVKPETHAISEKATNFHGISQDFACSHGMLLRDVLNEFMEEMSALYKEGARMVVHHLEFDCGIIATELSRANLDHFQELWATFSRQGLCTMDPYLGKWVRMCKGLEVAPSYSGNTMRLDDMLRCLASDTCLSARHTAGRDAHLHVLLFDALVSLMRQASCSERCPQIAS